MTLYQLATLGLVVAGFVGTWVFGAFKLGRAVEQMRIGVREEFEEDHEKIIHKIDEMEDKFEESQRTQDHNFGEVGHAMRAHIADVKEKIREVEIYGRDHYVKIPDFEKAVDRLGDTMKEAVADLKKDMRHILKVGPD